MFKKIVTSGLISLTLLVSSATLADAKAISSTNSFSDKTYHEEFETFCTTMVEINGKIHRDVYFMYSDERSSYWLITDYDPKHNVLRIEDRLLNKWAIDKSELKAGNEFTGIFDKSGRSILRIK